MKEVKIYEKNDKVRIEVEVIGVNFNKDGVPMYRLRNPQTGNPFDFTFSEEQIFSGEIKK